VRRGGGEEQRGRACYERPEGPLPNGHARAARNRCVLAHGRPSPGPDTHVTVHGQRAPFPAAGATLRGLQLPQSAGAPNPAATANKRKTRARAGEEVAAANGRLLLEQLRASARPGPLTIGPARSVATRTHATPKKNTTKACAYAPLKPCAKRRGAGEGGLKAGARGRRGGRGTPIRCAREREGGGVKVGAGVRWSGRDATQTEERKRGVGGRRSAREGLEGGGAQGTGTTCWATRDWSNSRRAAVRRRAACSAARAAARASAAPCSVAFVSPQGSLSASSSMCPRRLGLAALPPLLFLLP
jgi:hypothetical protein